MHLTSIKMLIFAIWTSIHHGGLCLSNMNYKPFVDFKLYYSIPLHKSTYNLPQIVLVLLIESFHFGFSFMKALGSQFIVNTTLRNC